jgi:hypothetical protein
VSQCADLDQVADEMREAISVLSGESEDVIEVDVDVLVPGGKPVVYMSVSEVAARIGVSPGNIAAYRMPEPDALIGKTRGWTVETIEAWIAARPGSGDWKTRNPRTPE